MENIAHDACPDFHAAVELIGRRWNGVVLQRLMGGPQRFGELRAGIPGITDAMLTQRLRELDDAGVVSRDVVVARPVEIRYSLTSIGAALSPVLDAVAEWSTVWAANEAGVTSAVRRVGR